MRDSCVSWVQKSDTVRGGSSLQSLHDLLSSYVGVVVWAGVRLRFIQTYDEQAALDELQAALVPRINAD